MVSCLNLLFSYRERGRGFHPPCFIVVLAKVLDHLIDNGMKLKVYRKETKKSNQRSERC